MTLQLDHLYKKCLVSAEVGLVEPVVCLFVEGIKTTCRQRLNNIAAFTIVALVIGPVHSSTNSTLWRVPCCHHGTGNYSNTQAITVQPGIHSLLGWESAHTGEVSCPRTQRPTRQLRPIPKTFQSKVADHSHTPQCPACIWRIQFRCTDTEGGHCRGACCA